MSSRTRVLIAGAGVAAFEATLALRDAAGERVDIELVAPETKFWYRPLAVAEPFGLGEVLTFDLPQLAAEAGAQFTPGEVVALDSVGHVARTKAGGAATRGRTGPQDALGMVSDAFKMVAGTLHGAEVARAVDLRNTCGS